MKTGIRTVVEAAIQCADPQSWPYTRAIDRVVTHVTAANSNVTTEAIAAHATAPTADPPSASKDEAREGRLDALRATTLESRLEELGVLRSFSRPWVSNDNPDLELLFCEDHSMQAITRVGAMRCHGRYRKLREWPFSLPWPPWPGAVRPGDSAPRRRIAARSPR